MSSLVAVTIKSVLDLCVITYGYIQLLCLFINVIENEYDYS